MTVRRHAMQRAQNDMRLSGPIALDKRRAMLGYDALQEIEQQFQLPISGTTSGVIAFSSIDLVFDVDFFDAPEQRDSSLAVPHFTYGAFIDPTDQIDNPTGAVLITACVSSWVSDDRGAITGATVTVGSCMPGGAAFDFTGYVHLTFQGYGALAENVATLDVGT